MANALSNAKNGRVNPPPSRKRFFYIKDMNTLLDTNILIYYNRTDCPDKKQVA
jgi:hypothetical protein